MAFDPTKPANGTKPVSAEIRANFTALKALADSNDASASSIAADVSGLDTELSDLASLLSESYYTISELDAGQLDNRYYTETETNSLLNAKVSSSILTTVGDLLTKGSGGLQRLAAGAVGTVLSGKGTATLPAWEDPGAYKQVDIGTFSRTKDAATGTQEIACDFEPDIILFFAAKEQASFNLSVGVYDGTNYTNILIPIVPGISTTSTSYAVRQYSYSTSYQIATVSAKDSDSFTLSWTKGGSGTGYDIKGIWIAIGS